MIVLMTYDACKDAKRRRTMLTLAPGNRGLSPIDPFAVWLVAGLAVAGPNDLWQSEPPDFAREGSPWAIGP